MRIPSISAHTMQNMTKSGMKKISKMTLPKQINLPNSMADDVAAKARTSGKTNWLDSHCGSAEQFCTPLLTF